ncbi:glycosyltransferase WbsX family protein [Clostridium perfringens]|uniref:glycosyltransferase WbsX family protein n=1 Tax=Clostridium perfringens TaxID=1502 RepID=UPI003754D814
MKLIAFYLPQFHEIKENNEWWGQGFTEWTNTKKANKLFYNHNQPREPLNDYYYNLLDNKTKIWQTDLANKYGIYGFCYYHYWFNGKMLLEKPLEQVLKMSELKQNFCISWANEPWTRSWYAGREREVLIEQNYGDKREWKEHLDYLIQFFNDERYIKVNNKPMLLIYRPESIECFDEMIGFWEEEMKKIGFAGIHIVKMLNCFENNPINSKLINYNVEFEPGYTIKDDLPINYKCFRKVRRLGNKLASKLKIKNKIFLDIIDYNVVWNRIIRRNHKFPTYLGAFVDWDNTARRGENALIMKNNGVENFKKYFEIQVKRSKKENNEFLFINAWNEWAEGTYLEPDKRNGYKYLEAIKEVMDKNV